MRYRITTRGKIVIFVLVIMLVTGVTSIISPKSSNEVAGNENIVNELPSDSKETGTKDDMAVSLEAGNDLDETKDIDLNDSEVDEDKQAILESSACRLYFKPDKYEILESELVKLNDVIEVSKIYSDEMIIIESNINGYPEYLDSEFGLELSDMRVEVVKKYLIRNGISEDRVYTFSLGSQKPIENTNNLMDCWKNRRTDVYFKDYNSLEY